MTVLPSIWRSRSGDVGGDDVDDAEAERLLGRDVGALADGLLGPVGVAAPLLGQRADVRRRVVRDLGAHLRRHLLLAVLAHRDGRSRADVGVRRHRGDVRGVGDVDAGRAGPRARRRDVDDDRDVGGEDALDDLAHRRVEAAGRVKLDHDGRGPVDLGLVDGPADEVGERRVDDTTGPDDRDGARRDGRGLGLDGRRERRGDEPQQAGARDHGEEEKANDARHPSLHGVTSPAGPPPNG